MSLSTRIQLLRRFLQGKTNERENKLVDQWYYAVNDVQPVTLWIQEGKKAAVKEQIREGVWKQINRIPQKKARLFSIQRAGKWVAAASIITVAAIGYWWRTLPLSVTYYTITVPLGQVKQVQLPDSSIAWLKSGTTLRYNSAYNSANRELELLNGEAFFAVQQSSLHPFMVKSGRLQTRVLGTTFDIRSYTGGASIQVWVEQGRVQVSDSGKVLKELGKNHRLQWNTASHTFTCDSLEWRQALSWQKGILLLESASFDEVASQLQEVYGIRLITNNAAIRRQRYDAKFFIHTPVTDVIATLAEIHGTRYRKQGDSIIFY